MSKIVIFGESGNQDSALKAYRIAYRNCIDEAYQVIREIALDILKQQYNLQLHQLKFDYLNYMLNNTNKNISAQLRDHLKICKFYYEHGKSQHQVRIFRCFISTTVPTNQLNALSRKLAKYYYQSLYLALEEKIQEQA